MGSGLQFPPNKGGVGELGEEGKCREVTEVGKVDFPNLVMSAMLVELAKGANLEKLAEATSPSAPIR